MQPLSKLTTKLTSVFLIAAFLGCGNTATITRANGPTIEARIVGSDGNRIYVEGAREGIPRDEIIDIDHPGNGAAVTGAILSVYGVLNIAAGAPRCETEGADFCTGVFLPLSIGLPLMIYGIVVYSTSTRATENRWMRNTASLKLVPSPLIGPSGTMGFGVGGTF